MSCNSCGVEIAVEGCLHAESFDLACRNCGDWITRGDPSVRRGRWYVVLAGETLGPLRTAVVADLLGKQLLDEEEGVWREGYGEWRPLHAVPEFARLVSPPVEPTTILSIDEIEFESASHDDTAALAYDDASGWDTTMEPRPPRRVAVGGGHVHRPDPAPVAGDLIVASGRPAHLRLVEELAIEEVEFVPAPVVRAAPGAPAQRISRLPPPPQENSVVFSLGTLQNLVQAPRFDPGPALPAFGPKNLAEPAFAARPVQLPTPRPIYTPPVVDAVPPPPPPPTMWMAPHYVAPTPAAPTYAYATNAMIALHPIPRRKPGRLAIVALLWTCVGAFLALALLTRLL